MPDYIVSHGAESPHAFTGSISIAPLTLGPAGAHLGILVRAFMPAAKPSVSRLGIIVVRLSRHAVRQT
jgi:hypothetical protein